MSASSSSAASRDRPVPEVFVGVGSNTHPRVYLETGVAMMRERFGELRLSSVYRNQAVGFEGQDFYNLVAAFDSDRPANELAAELREIEDRCDRDRSLPKYGPRTLDLDLLLYGDAVASEAHALELPREEILKRSYILRPMAELRPHLLHPVAGRDYAALWAEFDRDSHPLVEVELKL